LLQEVTIKRGNSFRFCFGHKSDFLSCKRIIDLSVYRKLLTRSGNKLPG
jgi:hypothetical protein